MKTIKRYGKVVVATLLMILMALAVINLSMNKAEAIPRGSVREKLGNYTGPITGVAADDNVKAHNDLIKTDTVAILVDGTQAATAHAAMEMTISKSLSTIASGANNLFAVAGGPIKMTEFVIYIDSVIETQTTLVGGLIDPTTPATDTVFGTDGAAVDFTAAAAGTVFSWDGVLATDFAKQANGVVLAMGTDVSYGMFVPVGMIELTSSAASTGTLTVYMSYIPLNSSVTVTAQ